MRLAITGHRPNKLGDYDVLMDNIRAALVDLGVTYMYQGMAPGADIISAKAAAWSAVPYCAVVPWKGHRKTIHQDWLEDYDRALKYADYVEVLSDSEEYLGPWLYHNRNKFMVDHADAVLAIWNGDNEGGTASTVKYSMNTAHKPVHILHPTTLELTIANQTT